MRTIPECTESELSADKTPEPRQIYGDENAQMILAQGAGLASAKVAGTTGGAGQLHAQELSRLQTSCARRLHNPARRSPLFDRQLRDQPSIWVEVPGEHLAVGLQRARCTMLTIAKLHKDVRCDDIYCFADDHATRNKWTGIFRRMGVPIFDEREERHADAVFPLGPSA